MNNIELMEFNVASQVVKELGREYGYMDFKSFATTYGNSLDKLSKLSSDIKGWDSVFLMALLSLGPYYGLQETADLKPDGTGTRSAWYTIANAIRKELTYRNTTRGKKEILRKMMPAAVRGADVDSLEKLRNEKIKAEMKNGKACIRKNQAILNEERLQHIYALEETLVKDGSLRTLCDEIYEKHSRNIQNLPTNEEAESMVKIEKRKNKVLSLILSWFIMPIYVIIRAIDLLCDSVFVAKVKNEDFESRFNTHAPYFGRLTIPFLLSGFVAFTDIIEGVKEGKTPMCDDASFQFIMTFLGALLVITIVKSLVGFPAAYVADFIGKVAEWASDRFESVDSDYFQFGLAEASAAALEQYRDIFETRQKLICDLRDAIANNTPRCELDDLRKRGAFSLKSLQKEKEAFMSAQRRRK